MRREVLRIEYGEKLQDGIQILKDIYLQVFEKEFFGIIFQNIQEKENFLAVMRGEGHFDNGYLCFGEQSISMEDSCDVMKINISVIGKGETLFFHMPVYENIYLMEMNRGKNVINLDDYEKRAEELMCKYQLNIQTSGNAGALTLMEKVVIEMLSAFEQGKRVIILEDIIAMLQKNKQNVLWNMIQSLRREGVTFIFIESLNHGILNYVERIGIVEKGTTIGIYEKNQMPENLLLRLLEKNGSWSQPFAKGREREILLEFCKVRGEGLQPVTFSLKRGGLIFLLCEDVNVYERMQDLIMGDSRPEKGKIYHCGQLITTEDILAYQGRVIGIIRELPVKNMVFHNISVMDNLCLPFARKIPGLWCNRRFRNSIREKLENILPAECFEKKIGELSQSEILKIVYLRWYLYKPEVVICIRPFESGDLEMIQQTQEMIGLLMRKGIAVIIITLTLKNVETGGYEICYIENRKNEDSAFF